MAILHHRFPGICIWLVHCKLKSWYILCQGDLQIFDFPWQKRWDRTCGAHHFLHLIRWMSATKCCKSWEKRRFQPSVNDMYGNSRISGFQSHQEVSNGWFPCSICMKFLANNVRSTTTGRCLKLWAMPRWNTAKMVASIGEALHILAFTPLQFDKRSWKVWCFSLLCIDDAWSTS